MRDSVWAAVRSCAVVVIAACGSGGGDGNENLVSIDVEPANATLTFTGRGVTWFGPTGPTRGRAKVYVDGKLVRTVDLRRSAFHARSAVYSKRWSSSRTHTIRVVVLGTSGRSMVAIDDFGIAK